MLRTDPFSSEADGGRAVAAALTGAWHRQPPPFPLDPQTVSDNLPPIVRSGAPSLIWRRVRDLALPDSAALQLRDAYRYDTLQAAVHESRIGRTFAILRDAGIEPILVKGWAVARLYPEPGLRPYGDIDLCVRPAQAGASRSVVRSPRSATPRIRFLFVNSRVRSTLRSAHASSRRIRWLRAACGAWRRSHLTIAPEGGAISLGGRASETVPQ